MRRSDLITGGSVRERACQAKPRSSPRPSPPEEQSRTTEHNVRFAKGAIAFSPTQIVARFIESGLRTLGQRGCVPWAVGLAMFLGLLSSPISAASTDGGKVTGLKLHVQLPATSEVVKLRGPDARQQVLVTATVEGGGERDLTRQVTYEVAPAGIVQVEKSGLVKPLADGTATITAKGPGGSKATLAVAVEHFKTATPVNFANQIVPIFTKAGCNGGGCHGKSSGQNGFRLSLLGFEPAEDYEHLVKEARGRRLFPASPERSLLLMKGAGTVPHGGGKHLEVGSFDYNLIARWIAQGMPYGATNAPSVAGIEVFPKERTMARGADQQLVVMARYTDGTLEDVTQSALYEANDKDMARTDSMGRVTFLDQPGDVAVMVRYQAKVAVFQATIPLGAPVDKLPAPRNFVDELVFKKLKAVGLPPSEECDDATFLRRVTVDLAGRLPSAEEARAFLADKEAGKRDRWIAKLLGSPEYADYFANKWSALLRNKRTAPTHTRGTYAFYSWIRDSLLDNKPYDVFARDIVAASGEVTQNPPVAWYRQVRDTTAQLEDTAQLFLGMRLQCAQCHHHPYEKWSQQDYYGFAAFFSQVGRKASGPGEEVIFHRRGPATAQNKKTKQNVKPAGLGAPVAELAPDDDPREALADWMTQKNNPYFAKSLVNRYWKHLFGRGLVDPEDDLRETNPPTNPELLDALADDFVSSGYDLKHLLKTICESRVYQLSALPNEHNLVDKKNYSRYYPKRLAAEVLYDAVNGVTRSESAFEGLPRGTRAVSLPDNSFNASSYFLTVFGRPESSSACECERSQDASLAQSLHLLNAKDIQDKLASDTGAAAALAADTKRTDEEKIRELYYTAYSRQPEAKEMMLALSHIEKKTGKEEKPGAGKRQAYEDILWALINTKEFLFNH
jgi:hypothetical protein